MFDLDRWNEIFITLRRNKTRSFLTAFGVFWGIFMLIALIGGGNGLKKKTFDKIGNIATNSCVVWSGKTSEPYKGFRKGRYWDMTNKDIEIIKSKVKGLDEISPVLTNWNQQENNVVRGDKKGTFSISGNYANFDKIDKQKMKFGRYLNNIDVDEQRKVCVIGTRVYETLFKQGENPIGQTICIDGIYYRIVGVGEGGDSLSFVGDKRELITLPFTTMQKIYNFGNIVQMFVATANSNYSINKIQTEIETILRQNHSISPTDKQAIDTFNLSDIFGKINGLMFGISILAFIVGFGTLFAGIIGVSNIMMVTVKERTQEIGIRRAIGANPTNIMTQIMSESFVLTSIAGFLGIAFAVLVLQIVDLGLSQDGGTTTVFQVGFGTAILAATIIIILGTLAGLGPAFRAMKIKPIEALRDE